MSQEIKNDHVSAAVVELLQAFLKADPEGCNKLLGYRVKTTKAVVDHEFIQAGGTDAKPEIGVLGIINGLLNKLGSQRVAMCIDNDKVVGFQFYTLPK